MDMQTTTPTATKELHGLAASPLPPPEAAADWTVPQHWERFTAADHAVWDLLFARQVKLLQGRAVSAFHDCLDVLSLSHPGVPDFAELNARLNARTGWTVVAVPGLIPDDVFYAHLAKRQFPAGNFIRSADELDYLEEPDVFHDVFGHVPLLADPAFADFMETLGHIGLAALAKGDLARVAHLYWRTVEFGLAREDGELRIYGAGILSSFGETRFALESDEPQRIDFDLEAAMTMPYRSDRFQDRYFVLDRFEDVLKLADRKRWAD